VSFKDRALVSMSYSGWMAVVERYIWYMLGLRLALGLAMGQAKDGFNFIKIR